MLSLNLQLFVVIRRRRHRDAGVYSQFLEWINEGCNPSLCHVNSLVCATNRFLEDRQMKRNRIKTEKRSNSDSTVSCAVVVWTLRYRPRTWWLSILVMTWNNSAGLQYLQARDMSLWRGCCDAGTSKRARNVLYQFLVNRLVCVECRLPGPRSAELTYACLSVCRRKCG